MASQLYRKAAEQGHAQAVKLLHNAAENGNAHAQNNLGFMYDQGKGVPQDYVKALQLYCKATNQGYAPHITLGGACT